MRNLKQIGIKNWTYYFYNDIINIEESDSNLLKIDKKSYKDIDIYSIGYITNKKVDDCENIYCAIPLYLIIDKVDEHIECKSVERSSAGEKNGKKYLVFDFTDENEEILKKYTDFWDGIKIKNRKNKWQ